MSYSVLGIFMQKCLLSFENMTFEKCNAFYDAFKMYLETALHDPKKLMDMSDLCYQSPVRHVMPKKGASAALHTMERVLDSMVKRIEGTIYIYIYIVK
jgi:hypothetical protein